MSPHGSRSVGSSRLLRGWAASPALSMLRASLLSKHRPPRFLRLICMAPHLCLRNSEILSPTAVLPLSSHHNLVIGTGFNPRPERGPRDNTHRAVARSPYAPAGPDKRPSSRLPDSQARKFVARNGGGGAVGKARRTG